MLPYEVVHALDYGRFIDRCLTGAVTLQITLIWTHHPEVVEPRHHRVGIKMCLITHDNAACVTTLDDILTVPELLHQSLECVGGLDVAETGFGGGGGEGKAWDGRGNYVKSWHGRLRRVEKERQEWPDFEERAWPAVDEQQGDRVFAGGTVMDEMQRDRLGVVGASADEDFGGEVGESGRD